MSLRAGSEIRPLTGLRGVAALYVLSYHHRLGEPFSNPLTTLHAHGYLAVDLFFVLSGFVMALSYGNMFNAVWSLRTYFVFLGRRIARIYPLYFASTVAGIILVMAGILQAQSSAPLVNVVILNLFLVQSWGFVRSLDLTGWSISAEWAAYLMFPALIIPTMFRRPLIGWLCGVLCAVVLAVLCTLPAGVVHHSQAETQALLDLYDPYLGLPVIRCLPEFVLGILAFRLSMTTFGRAVSSSPWIPPLLCLVTIILMSIPKTDLAVVLIFPLLVMSLISEAHFVGKILASPVAQLAGALSYSIYLIHALLFGLPNWLLTRVHASRLPHARMYDAILGLALTLAISYVAYKTIETPGRRLLRSWFEGPPLRSSREASLVRTGQRGT